MADQNNKSIFTADQTPASSGRPSLAHIPMVVEPEVKPEAVLPVEKPAKVEVEIPPAEKPVKIETPPAEKPSRSAAPSSRVISAVQAQEKRETEGQRKAERAERTEARAKNLGIDTKKGKRGSSRPSVAASAGAAKANPRPMKEEDSSEEASRRKSVTNQKKPKLPSIKLGPFGIALLIVLLVVAIVLGSFGIYRWVVCNDAADLQGTWVGEDTTRAIVVTESEMNLDGQASYTYELDATGKSLSTSFQNLSGLAYYRFSLDRSSIAIMDAAEIDATKSFFDDFCWTAADLFYAAQGKEHSPLTGEGVLLTRATKKQIAAFEAEAKKQQENIGDEGESSEGEEEN